MVRSALVSPAPLAPRVGGGREPGLVAMGQRRGDGERARRRTETEWPGPPRRAALRVGSCSGRRLDAAWAGATASERTTAGTPARCRAREIERGGRRILVEPTSAQLRIVLPHESPPPPLHLHLHLHPCSRNNILCKPAKSYICRIALPPSLPPGLLSVPLLARSTVSVGIILSARSSSLREAEEPNRRTDEQTTEAPKHRSTEAQVRRIRISITRPQPQPQDPGARSREGRTDRRTDSQKKKKPAVRG